MADLDHVSHMPDGVDTGRWDRLVAARRKKWDSELKVENTHTICMGLTYTRIAI